MTGRALGAAVIAWAILGGLAAGADADRLAIFEAIARCPGKSCVPCAGKDLVTCGAGVDCRTNTVEWARDREFVAIRDLQMCVAPASSGLIHGLAMPIERVEGAEGPRPPAGIWAFAWDVAIRAIGAENEDEIALLVNPCGRRGADGACTMRSQDQLHVHILRFCKGKKDEALAAAKPIARLDDAWAEASSLAPGGLARGAEGVIVARRNGEFVVTVHMGDAEARFTSNHYDPSTKALNCSPGP